MGNFIRAICTMIFYVLNKFFRTLFKSSNHLNKDVGINTDPTPTEVNKGIQTDRSNSTETIIKLLRHNKFLQTEVNNLTMQLAESNNNLELKNEEIKTLQHEFSELNTKLANETIHILDEVDPNQTFAKSF